MTLEKIAQLYNCTRERVRQIETRALRRLRHPTRLRMLRPDTYEQVSSFNKLKIDLCKYAELITPSNGSKSSSTHIEDTESNLVGDSTAKQIEIHIPIFVLYKRIKIGHVFMTVKKWLETFGLEEDAFCKYLSLFSKQQRWMTKNLINALDHYLWEVAKNEELQYDELHRMVEMGYSLRQVIEKDFILPDNILDVTFKVLGRGTSVRDWLVENESISVECKKRLKGEIVKDWHLNLKPLIEYAESWSLAKKTTSLHSENNLLGG